MFYIGWDIGIKNLAYCIIEVKDGQESIKDLGIINLVEDIILIPEKKICNQVNKSKTPCKSKAKYIYEDLLLCEKHYKLSINNLNLKKVKEIKPPKKVKCKSIPLEVIGKTLFSKLDENKLFIKCENIIIENQPVLKNPTMKSIQMMLYSYFLIKNQNIKHIQLVNASNKIKVYKGKLSDDNQNTLNVIKDKYKKNKTTAIIHCQEMMALSNENKFLEYFNKHKKKDDLADAYLMSKYLIKKI